MRASGESYGVIGALQAFPLRLATRRVQSLGGRLHRNITRGTTAVVLGRKELLSQLAPLGPVYQAGTMAGNPVCLAAGVATLTELAEGDPYRHIEMLGRHLDAAYASHALKKVARLPRIGPIVWPYFDVKAALPVAASAISAEAVSAYHGRYRSWLARGVYLPPSAYEVCFLSAAHTTADIDRLLDVLAHEA